MTDPALFTWYCPKCKKDTLKVKLDGKLFWFHCACGFDSGELKFGGKGRAQSFTKAYAYLCGYVDAKVADRKKISKALKEFDSRFMLEEPGDLVCLFG